MFKASHRPVPDHESWLCSYIRRLIYWTKVEEKTAHQKLPFNNPCPTLDTALRLERVVSSLQDLLDSSSEEEKSLGKMRRPDPAF